MFSPAGAPFHFTGLLARPSPVITVGEGPATPYISSGSKYVMPFVPAKKKRPSWPIAAL